MDRTDVSPSFDPDPDLDAGAASRVAELLSSMEAMPAHPAVALRVVWLVDDPAVNAVALARTVELDPVLSARLMRIANSAYYSLRTPVSNVPRAITALGFSTVKALATTAGAGIDDPDHPVPAWFWQHAAAVANASQLVAGHYDVGSSDAFALGLLHDLGTGLLHRVAPEACERIQASAWGSASLEMEAFGITHEEAGAKVLHAWRFPSPFTEAVANHHHRLEPREQGLTRCLIAGELIADLAAGELSPPRADAVRAVLAADGLDTALVDRIVARVGEEGRALAAVLSS
ncbi:MAG TPA: HDOD domain-containing protein [Acidimicrobiales bacterium]|nr:HDOD domain-containing protein [Acidimicrobiales bacterium]